MAIYSSSCFERNNTFCAVVLTYETLAWMFVYTDGTLLSQWTGYDCGRRRSYVSLIAYDARLLVATQNAVTINSRILCSESPAVYSETFLFRASLAIYLCLYLTVHDGMILWLLNVLSVYCFNFVVIFSIALVSTLTVFRKCHKTFLFLRSDIRSRPYFVSYVYTPLVV